MKLYSTLGIGILLAEASLLRDYPLEIINTDQLNKLREEQIAKQTSHIQPIIQPIILPYESHFDLKNLGFNATPYIKNKKKSHENQSTSKFIPNTRKQH